MNLFILIFIFRIVIPSKVILFDQAHSQTNWSSYDFIVDDNSPIPQPYPPTGPNSWNGQLSTWGYELYLASHTIRNNTSVITPSVLNGVDLLIIPEPQDTFRETEMDAIENFVLNGGALFIIADHNSSDRNGNGWDSPSIFDGYSNPHITTPPGSDVERFIKPRFGLHLHVKDEGNNSITGTWTNVSTNPQDPIIRGFYGNVNAFTYHVGNVFTIYPNLSVNFDSVMGHIWKNSSPQGNTLVIVATGKVGNGKIAGIGDSSPFCDGSGPTSHANNWTETDNRELILNTSYWLLEDEVSVDENMLTDVSNVNFKFVDNILYFQIPKISYSNLNILDLSGRKIFEIKPDFYSENSTIYQEKLCLRPSVYFIFIENFLVYKIVVNN